MMPKDQGHSIDYMFRNSGYDVVKRFKFQANSFKINPSEVL